MINKTKFRLTKDSKVKTNHGYKVFQYSAFFESVSATTYFVFSMDVKKHLLSINTIIKILIQQKKHSFLRKKQLLNKTVYKMAAARRYPPKLDCSHVIKSSSLIGLSLL